MQIWFAAALITTASAVASADPAPAEPKTCAVTIVRAPEDVRKAVDSWLANEVCKTPLTVRILDVEGGYYIYAIDDHNRVLERTVPDVQSVGALIASWTADDGIVKPEPVPAPPPPQAPPGPTATVAAQLPAQHLVREATRWLSLAGGAGGTNNAAGVRLELEVFHTGAFSAAIHLAYGTSRMSASDAVTTYLADFDDLSAMVGLHYSWRFNPAWHLRIGFAVGVMATQMSLDSAGVTSNPQTSTAVTEGSLMVGYTLADRWEVEIGPVATLANEHWHLADQMETLVRAPGSVVAFAGVRRAL